MFVSLFPCAGQKAIEGELRSHGVNHLGTPEVTVSEGFTVTDVTKVR